MASTNTKGHGPANDSPEIEDAQVRTAPGVDAGFKRNILIIGGVVFVMVALVVVAWMRIGGTQSKADNSSAVGLDAPRSAQADPDAKLSPKMQDGLAEVQRRELKEDAAKGLPVSVPKDVLGTPEPIAGQTDVAHTPQPFGGQPATPAAAAPAEDPYARQQRLDEEQRVQQAADELHKRRLELAAGQLGAAAAGREVVAPVRVALARTEGSGAGNTNSGVGAGSGAATSSADIAAGASNASRNRGPLLVDGLEIFTAELASPVDSYKGNYVSAKVLSGRLAGAFMTGQVQPTAEGVEMAFTRMRFANQTCPISARGLDELTSSASIDANIDRRYIERFVWPVVVAVAGGYTQAKAQVSQQAVGGPNGVAVTQPAPTRQQAEAAGAAAGLGILRREVDLAAGKPPQFKLPAGQLIGVSFTEPVAVDCR